MKNLKRILSVMICVLLALSVFTACGKKPETPEESTTAAPETTAIPQVSDFEEATFGISTALAMGMRFFDDASYLDNASVLWNTLGWYCCRQESKGGNGYLTRTQVDALQHALRPGKAAISAPDNWIKGGSLEIKEIEGETRYFFKDFDDIYEEMEKSLKPELSVIDGSYVKVVFTNEENEKETYVFGFEKDEAIGGEFPYILKNMELPPVQTAKENEADFTVQELIDANSLTNLLDIYKTIKVHCYFDGKEFSVNNYFKKNGEICMASRNDDVDLPYGASYYGFYGDREFSLCHFEDNPEKTYLSSTEFISLYPEYSEGYSIDTRISQNIDYGYIANVVDKGETYTFDMYYDYSYTEEDGDMIPVKFEVDKGTLALKKIVWSEGTEYENTNVYEYGVEVDDYGMFDSFDRPFRKVTVVAELHDENLEEINFSRTYEVPDNMELYPVCYKMTNLYFNKNWTNEYKYSENLGDYTIYVTDVMG
ncbi:MAG: hypothetical protein IK097_09375 [Clostridia bacterium]|nr:hypothetical protein [Clostridia bacterium]